MLRQTQIPLLAPEIHNKYIETRTDKTFVLTTALLNSKETKASLHWCYNKLLVFQILHKPNHFFYSTL